MAKRFRLKLSRVLVSFLLCRSKKASTLPEIPVPIARRLSPAKPKAFRNHELPAPPPSTPDFSFIKRHLSPKMASVTKDGKGDVASVSLSRRKGKRIEKGKGISSSGCFGSQEAENEETETLISNSRSFWNVSSFELNDQSLAENSHMQTNWKKLHNMKMEKTPRSSSSKKYGTLSSEKQRMVVPHTVEGKVRGSIAVVRRSDDPYEDFKGSMMEMIVEKQMFEAKDLEQLLQCFVSLNSRQYHGIILEAFTEICEALFCAGC